MTKLSDHDNDVWANTLAQDCSTGSRRNRRNDFDEIVIFDAKTLEEKGRIKGFYAPTGKFNVYNRTNHVT
jgi:nitrite reductase (NO-forming)/hydroxylamine reductase